MRNANDSASPRVVPLNPSGAADDADDDIEMAVEGQKALLPNESWHQARYLGHYTALMFNMAPKVFLLFEISEPGSQYHGIRLARPYRVQKVVSPGPNGKFVLSAGGDLYRTLAKLLDTNGRPDRISLRPLKHLLFKVQVRTVVFGRKGKKDKLPESAQYSVIEEIEDGR